MRETKIEKKFRAQKVVEVLKKNYPDSKCSLNYTSPHELLIATILSAQCTDHRVNQVTHALFKKYLSLSDFAYCDVNLLAKDIHSCGYHNQKARNIQSASLMIVEEYNGQVPNNLVDLVNLPGVGRKTANCVLGEIYNVPTMVIDTHMIRIMNLLKFVNTEDPKKIEFALMKLFNDNEWVTLTHMIIDHGRAVCISRRPNCNECVLAPYCPSAEIRGNMCAYGSVLRHCW